MTATERSQGDGRTCSGLEAVARALRDEGRAFLSLAYRTECELSCPDTRCTSGRGKIAELG